MLSNSRGICVMVALLSVLAGAAGYAFAENAPVPAPTLPKPAPAAAPAAGGVAAAVAEAADKAVATPPKAPKLSARAAVVMDAGNGRVLYSLNPHQQRAPASLTKMVTALIAVAQPNLAVTTRVSSRAAGRPPSKLGLSTGDRISLSVLLQALLMGSCNDAATAIAEQVAGSEAAFATKMNSLAKKLGAGESHFVNPHGLDASGQYSTAYDLAVIARHLLNEPKLAEIVRRSSAYLSWTGGAKQMQNINSFLWRYDGAIGVKTGYTQKAGYALAAAAVRDGRRLIIILLGCTSSEKRWADAQVLMDYGMKNYTALSAAAARKPQVYVVRSGDTLTAIARRFNTTVEALLRANPALRANPNRLLVGAKLNLP